MAKTSTLRPIDEWETAPNRPETRTGSMSQLGQNQKSGRATGRSALPSRADMVSRTRQVRKVQKAVMPADSIAGRQNRRRRKPFAYRLVRREHIAVDHRPKSRR